MNKMIQAMIALTLVAALSGAAYAETAATTSVSEGDAVFQEFGGTIGIGKVIDDFLAIWQADSRINFALKSTNVERLGSLLKEQISQLTGGPAMYSGRDMKSAHQAMGLHNAQFNALAEDLQSAMVKNGVPTRAQNKLLSKLAPMEHEIVTQ